MSRTPRRWIASCLAIPLGLCASAAHAQAGGSAPNAVVKLVVPYPPGGAADVTARVIGQKLGELVGQPVVVDNKPGANGIIGTQAVAKAAPDGHTILMAPREVFGINPSLYASLPYDPLKDFSFLGILTEGPYVLVAHPGLGVKSMGELLALAKVKSLSYGSFGIGSMAHLNLEAFARRTGIQLTHVPYKGALIAVQAVVSGEVAISITTPPAAIGFLGHGRLVALGVGSAKRLAQLPDVPTLAEAGVPPDTLLPAYFGTAVPARTSKDIVAELNGVLKRALLAPEVSERLTTSGLIPVGSSPGEMSSTVAKDIANFSALIKAVGIKPE